MSVVIDNSIALAWVLPDEQSVVADAVLHDVTRSGAYVPFIFPAEFSNGLTMAMRRGRIDKAQRSVALDRIANGLHVNRDSDGANRMDVAVDLADSYDLTVYDALYLELARRIRLPLATLDRKLAVATRQAGIALVSPHA